MKVRNKKTGEVIILIDHIFDNYGSLAELNAEWEDVPVEPKEYWHIYGNQVLENECDGVIEYRFKEIGNYFETKEEAEKAVEKLKAWKRLKDKGFKFNDWDCVLGEIYFKVPNTFFDRPGMAGEAISDETVKDLDLLFGGEK